MLFIQLLLCKWSGPFGLEKLKMNFFHSADSPAKVSGAEFRQEQDLLFQDRKVGREAWLHNCSTSLACFFIKGTMWFPSLVNVFSISLSSNKYIYIYGKR